MRAILTHVGEPVMRIRSVGFAVAVTMAWAGRAPAQSLRDSLALAGLPVGAREAALASIDAAHHWAPRVAHRHAEGALSIDSTFGLARILRLELSGGTADYIAAESRRAVSDAAGRVVPEVTYVLARRAAGTWRSQLLASARAMMPGERRIALDHALSLTGAARLDSLRALSRQFADYAAPRMWLAFHLTDNPLTVRDPNADEAVAIAGEAVRIAPTLAGAHVALGHVLVRLGRYDDALPHLTQATTLDAENEPAYNLLAEMFSRDGKLNAVGRARAALDSAIAASPNATIRYNLTRNRALLLAHDGRASDALMELGRLARDAVTHSAALAATYNQQSATLAAGIGDSARARAFLEEARRLNPAANLTVPEVHAYGLIRNAAEARRAFEEFVRRVPNPAAPTVAAETHRLRGFVLLAERRYREALAELALRSDLDGNPFRELGVIQAHVALRNPAAADSVRSALLARHNVDLTSVSVAIARHQAATRR